VFEEWRRHRRRPSQRSRNWSASGASSIQVMRRSSVGVGHVLELAEVVRIASIDHLRGPRRTPFSMTRGSSRPVRTSADRASAPGLAPGSVAVRIDGLKIPGSVAAAASRGSTEA
jgi:hypothetical protein